MSTTPDSPQDKTTVVKPPPRRIVRNTIFSIVSKVQGAALNYLSTLILLQALSVENYGLYALLFSGALYNLGLLARFGVPSVLTRFVPEYYSRSEFSVIGKLLSASNLIQAAAAGVILAIVFLFADSIKNLIGFSGSEAILKVFAVGAFVYLLSDNFRLLIGSMFRQRVILVVNFTYVTARLCTLYFIVKLPNVLLAVVAAEASLYCLLLLTYIVAYRKTVRKLVKQDIKIADKPIPWRRFSKYASFLYMNEVGVTLLSQATDLLIVSRFLGTTAVGLYGLASRIQWIALSVLPNRILGDVIQPAFFSEYGSSDSQTAGFGFNLFLKVSLLASLPIGIWLSLMGEPVIVQLFNPKFVDAAAILSVIGAFLPVLGLRMPMGVMIQQAERPGLLIWAKVSGILKIAFGLWLVPSSGVLTMVWITCLASSLEIALLVFFIAWKLKVHADYIGSLRLLINAAISAAVFYPLAPYFHTRIGVLASIPIFAVIYLGINLLHRSFRQPERDFINSKLPKPLWRF